MQTCIHVLGTNTILAFMTLASKVENSLPKVSYIKASEIWFLGCTIFLFAAMVEFAFVNTIYRRKYVFLPIYPLSSVAYNFLYAKLKNFFFNCVFLIFSS